jgi:hypothetical protein
VKPVQFKDGDCYTLGIEIATFPFPGVPILSATLAFLGSPFFGGLFRYNDAGFANRIGRLLVRQFFQDPSVPRPFLA